MKGNIDKGTEEILRDIMVKLQELGIEVQQDKSKSLQERIKKADVLLNTMRFLVDYDENVTVLDRYWRDKHRKQKFNIDKEDR